jgi:hypothetical protein
MLSRHSIIRNNNINVTDLSSNGTPKLGVRIILLNYIPNAPLTKLIFYYVWGSKISYKINRSDMLAILNKINKPFRYFQENIVIYQENLIDEIEELLIDLDIKYN